MEGSNHNNQGNIKEFNESTLEQCFALTYAAELKNNYNLNLFAMLLIV